MATRILLALPLLTYQYDSQVFIDDQAHNGLRLWLDNFDTATLACKSKPGPPPPSFRAIEYARLKFVPLPEAYLPQNFPIEVARHWRLMGQLIDEATHLHFAIGGLLGDWASIFGIAAHLKQRPFAVWTDRVESRVAAFQASERSGAKRLYYKTIAYAMGAYERQIIKRSAIGLFHGMDCYSAYSSYSANPHLVHDIHLSKSDLVTEKDLSSRLKTNGPLRVVYAGRVHQDKGVFDWIEAMKEALRSSELTAAWFGVGPELDSARSKVAADGLDNRIFFPGAINDHRDLISKMKTSFDVFAFCHKTPESPRCLVEALICGLPIIGDDSPYPRNLIERHNGGVMTEPHSPSKLAAELSLFRQARESLTISAARDGATFNDEDVFRHRSELMKTI